jgi:hypothetical protein
MLATRDVNGAVDYLKKRTLASLRGDIARLVYVAGTRDYNSGVYYHDGVASCFTQAIANRALAQCHEESFRSIVEAPIETLVDKLEEYIRANCSESLLSTWLDIEPYRVLAPLACDPLSTKLFCSNFKIALSILASRAKNRRRD